MASPSSTSSSSAGLRRWARLPWAGLLALVCIVWADAAAFDRLETWRWLRKQDPFGVSRNQLSMGILEKRLASRKRVIITGSSRSGAFDSKLATSLHEDLAFGHLDRPGGTPLVTRSLVGDMIDREADLVVLFLSEFDTHQALSLEPAPGLPVASLRALWELARYAGPRFVYDNRYAYLRLALANLFDSYRYQENVMRSRRRPNIRFVRDERYESKPGRPPQAAFVLDVPQRPIPDTVRATFHGQYETGWKRSAADLGMNILSQVGPGEHVEPQRRWLRSLVDELREAGIDVLIAEAPIHPIGRRILPRGLRRKFLDFAASLAEAPGVHFMPLDEHAGYAARDFNDPLHLNSRAGAVMTELVTQRIHEILAGRDSG